MASQTPDCNLVNCKLSLQHDKKIRNTIKLEKKICKI